MSLSLSPGLKKAEKEVTNLLDKHLGLGPSSSHKPAAPPPPSSSYSGGGGDPGPKVTNIPIQLPDGGFASSGPKITNIPVQKPVGSGDGGFGFGKPSKPSNNGGFGLGKPSTFLRQGAKMC